MLENVRREKRSLWGSAQPCSALARFPPGQHIDHPQER